MENIVEFTPDAIKAYLDSAIRRWQRISKDMEPRIWGQLNYEDDIISVYQKIKKDLFGETLLEEESKKQHV